MPFIEEILNNIRAIICDLQPHHVHTFYEAVGYMIQAQVVSGWINTCVVRVTVNFGLEDEICDRLYRVRKM